MQHPEVASRPCSECARWIYDDQGRVSQRGGKPVPRPKNVPTPCHRCPKKSPAEARRMELSARNRRTLTLYLQVRATGGACLVGRMRSDPIVRKNMGILGWLFDQYDRDMTATSATLRKR